jgi:hypothetical protein
MSAQNRPQPAPKLKPGSPPPPRCKALLLCDHTILEVTTNKVSVIGIFNSFAMSEYPGHTRPFSVFLQFAEGCGTYIIGVAIYCLHTGELLGRADCTTLHMVDRLTPFMVVLPMAPLTLPHAGTYDIVITANGEEVDRQKVLAPEVAS